MEFDLTGLTLVELRNIAKANGVKSSSKYRKQELIDLLQEILKREDSSLEEVEITVPDQDPEEILKEVPRAEDEHRRNGEDRKEDPAAGRSGQRPPGRLDLPPHPGTEPGQPRKEQTAGEGSQPAGQAEGRGVPDRPADERRETRPGRGKNDGEKRQGGAENDLEKRSDSDKNDADRSLRSGEVRRERNHENSVPAPEERVFPPDTIDVSGILEIMDQNNFGFLRGENYLTTPDDIYVSPTQIRRFHLKTGDAVAGKTRPTREGEKFKALFFVDSVNGDPPGEAIRRRPFETLTPIFPNERLHLEVAGSNDMATRIMDIVSPVGKGQRGMIVAPPKAGKTTILKKIAQNLKINHPELIIIVLLIDERPEEVTDMIESIDGEVIYSTFDEDPMNHTKVAEMVLNRAKRLVEHKKDVVVLLDSLTRLSRAYNLTISPSGRTLSGGLDPAALLMPKKFFGAARNIRSGGSLTILATALVDTGSRMDDMIFEEFKGTGNMEVHLDRKLQERRIFPAIDIYKSGTRKEELILSPEEIEASRKIHRLLYRGAEVARVTEELISLMDNSENNAEFVEAFNRLQLS